MSSREIVNPFRPGAGHMPPYLAGRRKETDEFARILRQNVIMENLVLTGLRGVGKTVLMETFKPLAISQNWLWVGTDLTEAISISEERIALRLITDLAVVTSAIEISIKEVPGFGFQRAKRESQTLDFEQMTRIYQATHGIASDKLKAVLEFVWNHLQKRQIRGVVFAYDEAQNLADHAGKDEYPLSLMLDVFQSIQRKEIPFLLLLTGLPTLFPKLVEARTFAERMFRVLFLDRLNEHDSRLAIMKPIAESRCPRKFSPAGVSRIIQASGGYPYFIQFICREAFDVFMQRLDRATKPQIKLTEITRKLDTDFFAGRWARATDRQRDLLTVIARLENCDSEFTVQEIAAESKRGPANPFSPSQISQMLSKLSDAGLVYKNRHGKYSFAVPLLGRFILRQTGQD